jgi:hypothetical protein
MKTDGMGIEILIACRGYKKFLFLLHFLLFDEGKMESK